MTASQIGKLQGYVDVLKVIRKHKDEISLSALLNILADIDKLMNDL